MKFDPQIHHRQSVRLRGYDYARPGQYFVTVCTHRRELLFGEVVAGQMRRNALGDIVHAEWHATERIRPQVRLDAFIVMPNHFHGIMEIVAPDNAIVGATRRLAPTSARGPAPGSVGAIIGQIKSVTHKAINRARGTPGAAVWQRNYYEHVISRDEELERIREYICNNPPRWEFDRENPECEKTTEDEIADLMMWGEES